MIRIDRGERWVICEISNTKIGIPFRDDTIVDGTTAGAVAAVVVDPKNSTEISHP